MKKIFVALAAIALLIILASRVHASGLGFEPYGDVAGGEWYAGPARYAFAHGYLSGTGDGVFSPDAAVTRAQAAQMIARLCAADLGAYSSASSFADVARGKWFHDAAEWAAANGVTGGTGGGRFSPERVITRQEFYLMLHRVGKTCDAAPDAPDSAGSAAVFPDYENSAEYARAALDWAVGCGLAAGNGAGQLAPTAPVTRAQAAAILNKFDLCFGHDWDEADVLKARTCADAGLIAHRCAKCAGEAQVTLPAYHVYRAEAVREPTCAEPGEKLCRCVNCGDPYTVTLPATGAHVYVRAVVTAAAPDATGVARYRCRVCGRVDREEIARWSGYYPLLDRVVLPDGGYSVSTENIGLKVIYINRALLGTTDASYTAATKRAVAAFQRAKGLSATGVVDLATWRALGYTDAEWRTLGVYVTPMKVTARDSRAAHVEAMIATAKEYADARTAYRIGCSGRPGTYADCSGLIYQCLYSVGISPDTNIVDHARAEYEYTSRRLAKDAKLGLSVSVRDLARGDLLFYAKNGTSRVDHVAVYAGNYRIYDAWPGIGVTLRGYEIGGYYIIKAVRIFV